MAKKRITATEEVPVFHEILAGTPDESKLFVSLAMAIQARIHEMLAQRGWQQKDLAEKMHKSEAEISKLLSGTHNHTIRSLAKLHAAFGAPVINTSSNGQKNEQQTTVTYIQKHPAYSTKIYKPVAALSKARTSPKVIYMNNDPGDKITAV
ncbi:helix-turn-helix domain-containing protein [Chitinophaga defluvii]|uniref:Helix-turn-helix transcriptional regulator n=1 Tax=Chitinophaga defluvii TaxID=3163343 RepID=A0ABV2TCA9_9BACT